MSNIVTIYSPDGETFEVSKANARDLTTHRGWTYEKVIAAATPAPAPAPVEPVKTNMSIEPVAAAQPVPAEKVVDDKPVEDMNDAEKQDALNAAGLDSNAAGEGKPHPFTTAEEFADLPEKADVAAYLAQHFPDFKVDGRANRDKLVKQALELANRLPVEGVDDAEAGE